MALGTAGVDVATAPIDESLTRLATVQRAAAAVGQVDDSRREWVAIRVVWLPSPGSPPLLLRPALRLKCVPCGGIHECLSAAVSQHA
jgi:hypothetical protein